VFAAVSAAQEPANRNSSSATSESGTICILPDSPEPPTRTSSGGVYNPATLTVKVDQRASLPWPHKNSIKIEDLSLSRRHLLVLDSDGKRIQSFWFKFSDFKDNKLCVAFDGYQGVQLGDKYSALWCRCK